VTVWPVCLVVFSVAAGCLALWFREVRRVMREQKSGVEIALNQLLEWDNRLAVTPDDPDTAAIFERCKSIYEQAVDHHNRAMRKPFHYLPAFLMGFRLMSYSVIVFETPFDNGDIPIVLPGRKDNHS